MNYAVRIIMQGGFVDFPVVNFDLNKMTQEIRSSGYFQLVGETSAIYVPAAAIEAIIASAMEVTAAQDDLPEGVVRFTPKK